MGRWHGAIGALAAVLAAAPGWGCDGDGGAMVSIDLRTDWAPGIEFATVRVVVADGRTGRPQSATHHATRSQNYIDGVRVAELDLGRPGTHEIETFLLTADGSVLASRRTHAVVQGVAVITVVVARGGQVRCVADETCLVSAPCVEGRCESGICLMAPRLDACGPEEWCDVGAGECRPVPGGSAPMADGGMVMPEVDGGAGTEDAGVSVDSGPAEEPPTAFRATRLELRDPHLYARGPTRICMCIDGTSEVNGRTQDNIDSRSRNLVFVFAPYAPPGPSPLHVYDDARCPSDGSCEEASDGPVVTTVTQSGDQLQSAETDFTYEFDSVPVPLVRATFTATTTGSGPDGLVDGVLRGFITEDAARSARLPESGVLCDEPLTVYDVLRGGGACGSGDDRDDLDGDGDRDGWWLTVDFEATRVDWTP